MKTRYIVLIIIIALQLVLAFAPVMPVLSARITKDEKVRAQIESQIEFAGYGFALLTACLGFLLLSQDKRFQDIQETLNKRLPATRVEKLRDDDFYEDFLLAAKRAQSNVNIMYLAADPPDYTNHPGRKKYYRDLLNVIRAKPNVKFSRIMRSTPQTKQWIADLIRELDGCHNASVATIRDTDREPMPLALSTQIIDGTKVWFVAISAHERIGDYRDLFVENATLGEAMNQYYVRLLGRGKLLLDAGRVTGDGNSFLSSLNVEE